MSRISRMWLGTNNETAKKEKVTNRFTESVFKRAWSAW